MVLYIQIGQFQIGNSPKKKLFKLNGKSEESRDARRKKWDITLHYCICENIDMSKSTLY